MIRNWQKGLFGKQVQHSAMGYIKRRLKTNPKTIVVSRSFPSTQICPICHKNTRHDLSKRSYFCQFCGYFHPERDVKAALCILNEGLKTVSMEHRTKSPVEVSFTTANRHASVNSKTSPMKQEAQAL